MKTNPTFYDIDIEFEKAMALIGDAFSTKIHKRLEYIFDTLAYKFPIHELIMGMGCYTLRGDDIPIVYTDDNEESVKEAGALLDWSEYSGLNWRPKWLTHEEALLLQEAREALEKLTSTPYLTLYDWRRK